MSYQYDNCCEHLENYIVSATKIAAGATKNMSEEEQDKFREEHGIKRVGPALKDFKKW